MYNSLNPQSYTQTLKYQRTELFLGSLCLFCFLRNLGCKIEDLATIIPSTVHAESMALVSNTTVSAL